MAKVVKNERSWAIDMITKMNIFLQNKTLKIKAAGGESTINTGTLRMFPDIILYGDQSRTRILQGWEVKMPDTPITDSDFIKDAQRKAKILGLNSCVLWNFRSAVLYEKNEDGEFEIIKQWNDTSFINSRPDVEQYEKEWLGVLELVLIEINNFFVTGSFELSGLEEVLSHRIMDAIIERNEHILSEHFREFANQNRRFDSFINLWWNEVKEEYLLGKDKEDPFGAYSRFVLLNWINKITFANSIKQHHTPANLVEKIDYSITPKEGEDIFTEISKQCDFYNIFKEIDFGDELPPSVWRELVEYNMFFQTNGIVNFDEKSLQNILENNVRNSRRQVVGQFTTPKLLAEFMARITIENLKETVLDPCAGTGTITRAILDMKKEGIGVEEAYQTTWSSDKYSMPLQISTLNLTDVDAIDIPNKIFQGNVFDLKEGQKILITNPKDGDIIEYSLPKFNVILSNLPFVPFEIIEDGEKTHLTDVIQETKEKYDITMSSRSDLYSYIVIKLWDLLEEDGRLGIITSNSWLGTDVGKQFYEITKNLYKVEKIIVSGNKRWFSNADVVTAITILRKKSDKNNECDYDTRFITLNIALQELKDEEVMENITGNILLSRKAEQKYYKSIGYSQKRIEEILNMNVSINSLFHKVDWLLEVKDKLTKVTESFEVNRGERRGWDKLFYPEEGHNIEPEYIKKVLKSSRNLTRLIAEPDNDAFCCSREISELEYLNHHGAINWIRRFESEVNGVGRSLPEVLKRRNLKWYEMQSHLTADIITTLNPDRRLFYARFKEPSFINQRLIGLKAKNGEVDIELSHILLNSLISMFYLEAIGFGRGLGALDINKKNLEKTYMLNPNLLTKEQKSKIKEAFKPILNREVYETKKELEQEDRIHFEKTVLSSFGLVSYYDQIKQSLIDLQRTRLTAKER